MTNTDCRCGKNDDDDDDDDDIDDYDDDKNEQHRRLGYKFQCYTGACQIFNLLDKH